MKISIKRAGISESHYKSHTYEVGIDKSNEKDMMLIKGIPEAVKKADCFKSQLLSMETAIQRVVLPSINLVKRQKSGNRPDKLS